MVNKLPKVITLTGPAASGTGTIGRMLVREYGYRRVDTGAMYRAVGWTINAAGLSFTETPELERFLKSMQVEFIPETTRECRVIVDGNDVTDHLYENQTSDYASRGAALPMVRQALFDLQRKFGREGNVILDGQDTGTVVYPEADLKIYLDASPQTRAQRRFDDLIRQGEDVTLESVLHDIKERDERDFNREMAPLAPAEDAVIIRTDGETPDQTFRRVQTLLTRD